MGFSWKFIMTRKWTELCRRVLYFLENENLSVFSSCFIDVDDCCEVKNGFGQMMGWEESRKIVDFVSETNYRGEERDF